MPAEHKFDERSPSEVDYDLMVLSSLAALDRPQVPDDAEMAVAHPSQMAVLEVPHAVSMHWPPIPSILDLAESILCAGRGDKAPTQLTMTMFVASRFRTSAEAGRPIQGCGTLILVSQTTRK
jgi:hypothetical protein